MSATLSLLFFGAGPALADHCLDNGICYTVTGNGQGGAHVYFYGQPRVAGAYVATKYNVRGMTGGERQTEIRIGGSVEAAWGATVSVQGCRFLTFKSYCGKWSSFQAFP